MIVYIPKYNSVIASSFTQANRYFLYRDSGEEVVIDVNQNRITKASHLLNLVEVEYILNYIVKQSNHENRFLRLESKM